MRAIPTKERTVFRNRILLLCAAILGSLLLLRFESVPDSSPGDVSQASATCAVERLRNQYDNARKDTHNAIIQLYDLAKIVGESLASEGLLRCLSVIVKDNIDLRGLVTAAGSIVLERRLRPALDDAPFVRKLRNEGALIFGHANMDEFALGFRTFSSRGGQTLNFFDRTKFPGGSSGGTAVAVAAGLADIGIGTDTGGSVRIPASFARIFGLRPTTTEKRLKGVVPLSHSRDTIGLMAKRVDLVRKVHEVVTGKRCQPERRKAFRVGFFDFLPLNFPPEGFVRIMDDEVRELLEDLRQQRSTSYFEFENDLEEFLPDGITLKEIIKETESVPGCSQCAQIAKSLRKKIRGTLTKKEKSQLKFLTEVFPFLLSKALKRVMKANRLDAIAYTTFSKPPSPISSGRQLFCWHNRIAPALGWPALSIPFHPQPIDLLAPPNQECLLFDIAESFLKQKDPQFHD